MNYIHKFYIIDEIGNHKMELATCHDESTAYFLEKYCIETYKNAIGLSVLYKHGKTEKIILAATYEN